MKGTILVIDDDSTITGLLDTILSKEGYTIHIANNGRKGISMAKECRPDMIFMDISMPDLDGYQTTEEIKKDSTLKHVPVIYLTGRTESEDANKAFETGGASFMRKPFTVQQIKDFVNLAMLSLISE